MSQSESMAAAGHRARLRQRFVRDPDSLSEAELLELILTYAIPRLDVAPHAERLLQRFGGLTAVLTAPYAQLMEVSGIGEAAAILLSAMGAADAVPSETSGAEAARQDEGLPVPDRQTLTQRPLFEFGGEGEGEEPPLAAEPTAPRIGTFANDEAVNALVFIPQAAEFPDVEAYRAHLRERLPYNSASTRIRRANYIVERFFPDGRLDVPLAYFAAHCSSADDLKPVLFYHTLKAEPLAARVAEELIWPALPSGRVERDEIREFVLRYLPELSAASQAKALQAISNIYNVLGIGIEDGTRLRIQAHAGTLESFLYVLTAEFPKPAIHGFDALEAGPLRRWLLWDRDWSRRQLYNAQDLGILSKVSEIDTVRQFSLAFDQMTALHHYFENPQRGAIVLRENPAPNPGGSDR